MDTGHAGVMVNCRCCDLPVTSTSPSLSCSLCENKVHLSCLHKKVPSALLGDVFFQFICEVCSETESQIVTRDKMSWLSIVVLVLYNLHQQSQSSSRRGYFHWKIHICKFILDKWKALFPPQMKRKKSWQGTVSGTLTHNSSIFQSGSEDLGEPGWWRLLYPHLQPLQSLELKPQNAKKASKNTRNGHQNTPDEKLANQDKCELPLDLHIKEEPTWSVSSDTNTMYSRAYVEPSATLSNVLFDEEDIDVEVDCDAGLSFSQLANDSLIPDALTHVQNRYSFEDTFSEEITTPLVAVKQESFVSDVVIKQENESSDDEDDERTSYIEESSCKMEEPEKLCQPMSQFEEIQLMHRLQRAGNLPNSAARRLLRKLVVRHIKRQKNLPLFNIDVAPTGFTDKDPSLSFQCNSGHERVLDRFQTENRSDLSLKNQSNPSFLLRLVGHTELSSFRSPYTERLLKPYIMQESCSRVPWIQLMSELMKKVKSEWKPASLDYSYVRPQHISPINSLCREHFWPGIDVTESLQYPDFTCVALYKKLVVGFAFLVPDVNYNESYISYLFVRPEWRRAGIASFMLYHLIQTCMGKDVTLHVSATNPALILYQRFGFKVEEFVQDFYEKYFPLDSQDCRHALFLRLSR